MLASASPSTKSLCRTARWPCKEWPRCSTQPGRDDEWRDLYRQIAYRYIPTEQADDYVTNTIDQPRALLGVPLEGEGTTTVTWRMPVDEEDPTGIWHRRYYIDGSIMARIADGDAP